MYVQRNIETFLQPLLQWTSIEYYMLWGGGCVVFVIQQAIRMRHIVTFGSIIFFHIIP